MTENKENITNDNQNEEVIDLLNDDVDFNAEASIDETSNVAKATETEDEAEAENEVEAESDGEVEVADECNAQAVEDVRPAHIGAHAKQAQTAYMNKSARMRKVLITVITLLILLIIGMLFYLFQMIQANNNIAVQQTVKSETEAIKSDDTAKSTQTTAKKTTVPNLIELLGKTQDAAVKELGEGAQITRTIPVNEEGNPVKNDVQVALTAEPADTRSGTPTVYLSLDEAGNIIQVGYSAATSSLGYGTISFADAVEKENVIEKTLEDAGLTVQVGSAKLPTDKGAYSSYDTDGTTITKEYFNFSGTGTALGEQYKWESILSYDYSMANATDNLNDTIRTIYIYISK